MENISKLTPILYDKGETNFNHNGLGKLTKLLVNEIDEVLNGEFEALFEYPANGRLADKIDNEMFIKAKPNKKDDPHIFKIYDYELDTFTQTYLIYARSKNIEDLKNNVILDVNVRNLAPTQAYSLAKSNALDPVVTTFYSDITTTSSVHWERRSLLSTIAGEEGSMIQYWGGEIKHDINRISLLRRRGQDNLTTVRHGKNLDGLKATYSTKGLVTAIVPYYVKNDDKAVYGDVVESQYIKNYPSTYYDIIEYNDEELGLSREDEPENGYSDSTIKTALNRVAKRYFDENAGKDLPSINMEIALEDISQTKEYEQFKDFEQIEIGDTITVYSKKFNVNINAKVRRVVYNGLTDKNELVEVGTARRSLYDDVRDDFKKIETELQEGIDHAMTSANGKNTNYHGTADPNEIGLVGQNNDNYFRTNGQLKELWIYRDGMWHLEVGDLTGEQIRTEIAEQQQDIEEAKQQALDSKQEAIEEAERLVTEQDEIYQELFDGYDEAVSDLSLGLSEADKKAGDALVKAGESIDIALTASEGVARIESEVALINTKASDALGKADDAIAKANNIPASIDNVISAKGLVSGDWVNQRINDETGELYYALESVRGDIPDVILGVEWDKSGDPQMTRTDYVESYVNLDDYTMKMAEFNVSIDGLEMDLAQVRRDKLDSGVFTTFKTNEYANDINGIRQRLTNAEENKLDSGTFETFKEHDYQVTVNGLGGNINKLQRDKLDGDEFTNFKENDYQLTVDGFEMDLISMSGAIPSYVMGVEWDKSESPQMARTDYTEELDLTNQDAPDYIMGVEWNKEEGSAMVRTYDVTESPTKEEFELFLSEYSFRADGWDATNKYVTENSTAINSLINNAHGWQQTISYVDENQTKFNETVSQVDFYKQTLGSNAENVAQLVMTDEAFVTRIGQLEGMAEDVIVGVEWDKGSDPTMARTGYMDNWTESQVTQLANSWVMSIKSGYDIKAAINATTDGLRLLGKNILLDGNTLVTGNFAVSGKHVILDANTQVRGDFSVSGSNVILNAQTTVMGDFRVLGKNIILDGDTTIHGDFSVFGKNIILDGDTTVRGTFKVTDEMIAPNARIDGAKIADATIGSAKIASLDVSKISGDTAQFIEVAFNGINNWMHLSSEGIHMSGSGSWRRTFITPTGFDLYNDHGGNNKAGAIGYFKEHYDNTAYTENYFAAPKGSKHYIGIGANNTHHIAFGYQDDPSISRKYTKALQIDGDTGRIRFYRPISSGGSDYTVRFRSYDYGPYYGLALENTTSGIMFASNGIKIWDEGAKAWDDYDMTTRRKIGFYGDSGIQALTTNKDMEIWAGGSALRFYIGTNTLRFQVGSGAIQAYTDIGMNGNVITGQSDERLKTNIRAREELIINKLKQFDFVDFDWIESGKSAFGLIAQQVQKFAPELVSMDETNMLTLNNTLLNMYTTKSVVEINQKVDGLIESTDDKIHKLQQELSKANRRIQELEEKIA